MNRNVEGTISIVTALVLLFGMLLDVDPLLIGSVAVIALIGLGLSRFVPMPPGPR